ncbi:unnamed protein product, partial [Iphiclides podalirius]
MGGGYHLTSDCVQLQVYRDSKARWGGAASKASLSLQRYLGCESGFTLDKHSHTLALICQDFTAVLAFETRERLMQWQVKLQAHLCWSRQWVVVVAAGGRVAAGPARLLLRPPAAALAAGVPPRLLAVWELSHLRRYGVVEGRFCLEGGSLCGKSEGLHVLVTDQAAEIARDFDLASRGNISPRRTFAAIKIYEGVESPKSHKAFRSDTRLSELNTIDRSLPPMDLRLYEDPCVEEPGDISPYWLSAEHAHFQDMGLGDTVSVNETVEGADGAPWHGTNSVMLERCMSCISKLGALSRSSTAALTPGAKHFSPAWTMEALNENLHSDNVTSDSAKSCEKRNRDTSDNVVPNKENMKPSDDRTALYATVDLSRKTRRKVQLEGWTTPDGRTSADIEVDEGPLANYENLSFALSLEHYENAKDLLRKVGITESELNAIGANLKPESFAAMKKKSVCTKCGHQQSETDSEAACSRTTGGSNDEYLMMEPSSLDSDRLERDRTLAAGYTPMSPIGGFAFHTLKYAKSSFNRLLEEKSASNPALCPEKSPRVEAEGAEGGRTAVAETSGRQRGGRGRRSSSVDSSRFLEDVEEFEGSVGSRGSASSMETLRDLSGGRAPARAACECATRAGAAAAAPPGARDSCSSNDSGVSSWSLRSAAPPPPAHARSRRGGSTRRCRGATPRYRSARVTDAHSTSSGTSDMSDYVETLSMCSSQSSSDTPLGPCPRRAASTLRPRAGKEYRPLAPRR